MSRWCRPGDWSSGSAPWPRWTGWTSRSAPGRCWASWGPTARARPPRSGRCSASCASTVGRRRCTAWTCWRDAIRVHERISYVPGDVTLWGNLSGGECIDALLAFHGSHDRARRDELVERFELDPTKKARTYSKGNRQKVALVAALAADADLMILDEPTAGLDPLMEAQFQGVVREATAQGRTVLLSSHILGEVEALCDRVTIIRRGKDVTTGSLEELRRHTATTVQATTHRPVDGPGRASTGSAASTCATCPAVGCAPPRGRRPRRSRRWCAGCSTPAAPRCTWNRPASTSCSSSTTGTPREPARWPGRDRVAAAGPAEPAHVPAPPGRVAGGDGPAGVGHRRRDPQGLRHRAGPGGVRGDGGGVRGHPGLQRARLRPGHRRRHHRLRARLLHAGGLPGGGAAPGDPPDPHPGDPGPLRPAGSRPAGAHRPAGLGVRGADRGAGSGGRAVAGGPARGGLRRRELVVRRGPAAAAARDGGAGAGRRRGRLGLAERARVGAGGAGGPLPGARRGRRGRGGPDLALAAGVVRRGASLRRAPGLAGGRLRRAHRGPGGGRHPAQPASRPRQRAGRPLPGTGDGAAAPRQPGRA